MPPVHLHLLQAREGYDKNSGCLRPCGASASLRDERKCPAEVLRMAAHTLSEPAAASGQHTAQAGRWPHRGSAVPA